MMASGCDKEDEVFQMGVVVVVVVIIIIFLLLIISY